MIDCPHAARCPGCALIALSPDAQLEAKAERLATALAPFGAAAVTAPTPVRAADPVAGYRTRAKFAVAAGGRLGLYASGSHEVLDLPECRVLAPVIARAASAVRALLTSPPPAAGAVFCGVDDDLTRSRRDERSTGRLRAVDLREVVDETGAGVLLTLVVEAPAPAKAELDAACDALALAIPELRTTALSLHDGRSPQLLGRAPEVLRGEPLQPDHTAADTPWVYASPGSFAQAHRAQAAAIAREVIEAVAAAPGTRVLEVFAGSGALGLALAARGAHATLVESFAPAAEAALQAARVQSLADRVHVCIGHAEKELPRLDAAGERFDAVVVNPPRRGIAPDAREALTRLSTGRLVYVSCEPETLARDLAHFAGLGWHCTRLTPFDLMPQTREVETVAWLERGEVPRPTVLYEDAELLAVAKPPFLATIPHRERNGSLLERVQLLAPGAVPLHRLDADTSGVCLFAKTADVASVWQAALANDTTHKRYVALVRGQAREKGRIATPVVEAGKERAAATRYRRLELCGGHALLDVTLETGRTHQIRRHFSSVGMPVLGDARYGHPASNRHLAERHWLDRMFLHCASYTLVHPRSQATLQIEAPLPPDLETVLARLRVAGALPQPRGPKSRAKTRKPAGSRSGRKGKMGSSKTKGRNKTSSEKAP